MSQGSIFLPQYNPIVGRIQWREVDADYDFNQEIARSGYGDMLHDTDRNQKYFDAIKFTITRLKMESPGKEIHVLDIGTGTGLLAMMAAKAGADLVTACEAFEPMAKCAKRIIQVNNFSNIRLVSKRSTDLIVGVDLPRKANVLVAELFDTELIGEGALITYKHAAEHLLTSDAVLIPCAANLYLQVVESRFLWSHQRLYSFTTEEKNIDLSDFQTEEIETCHGLPSVFDIQASQLELIVNKSTLGDKQIRCLLDTPLLIKCFPFGPPAENIKLTDSFNIECLPDGQSLKAQHSGIAHAFIVWWSLQMEPTNTTEEISIVPKWVDKSKSVWRDHWMQAIYFPSQSYKLTKNEPFVISFSHDTLSMWFDLISLEKLRTSDSKFQFVKPLCKCSLHYGWSRQRIAELNSNHYHNFTFKIIDFIRNFNFTTPLRLVIFADCTYLPYFIFKELDSAGLTFQIFHVDTSSYSSLFLSPIYDRINKNSESAIKIFQSVDQLIFHLHSCDSVNHLESSKPNYVLLAEPYISSSVLSWDALYFWYASQQLLIKTKITWMKSFVPTRLRVSAVLVDFENLHRIRCPVESKCGNFDLNLFDDLILNASAKVDATVEPQPLWEYPCIARSDVVTVLDMDLKSHPDYGIDFQHLCSEDLVRRKANILTPSSLNINGIAFWAEWYYEVLTGKDSTQGFWYSPTGPIDTVSPNQHISWRPYGAQQGVYLGTDWVKAFTSDCASSHTVSVQMDFNRFNGVLSVSVNLVNCVVK